MNRNIRTFFGNIGYFMVHKYKQMKNAKKLSFKWEKPHILKLCILFE